jgi:hypothetical protein
VNGLQEESDFEFPRLIEFQELVKYAAWDLDSCWLLGVMTRTRGPPSLLTYRDVTVPAGSVVL